MESKRGFLESGGTNLGSIAFARMLSETLIVWGSEIRMNSTESASDENPNDVPDATSNQDAYPIWLAGGDIQGEKSHMARLKTSSD